MNADPDATGTVAYADLTLSDFTERLASAEPVPGGGSASAVAAAIAASLAAMVARLSVGRPRYAAYGATVERAVLAGEAARARLLELADADAAAYTAYGSARSLPRSTDAEQSARGDAVRAAARRAADVPLEIVRECVSLAGLVESLAGRSNLNASSDLNVAALLLDAGARGAAANVIVNLPSVEDEAFAGRASLEVSGYLADIQQLTHQTREAVARGQLRDAEG